MEIEKTEELDDNELSEALTLQQRLKKRMQMKILAPRLAAARKRSAKRIAGKEKLEARATRKAKNILIQKIAKKSKGEMSFAERQKVEAKLEKMKPQVNTMAKKLFKDVKAQEIDRVRNLNSPAPK
jgi:hypothetical protein